MDEDLQVAPEDVRAYLEEAKRALQSSRLKTSFGKRTSTHWLYVTLARDSELIPVIVTLEVRRKQGVDRLYLTEVRPPTESELVEMGTEQTEVKPFPEREARKAVLDGLTIAKDELATPPAKEEMRHGILACGGAPLAGTYTFAGWTISPAPESAASAWLSEKILLCSRNEKGRDTHDLGFRFLQSLNRLGVLLTVFWMRHIYEIRTEHRWVIEPDESQGELKLNSKLVQMGYAPRTPLQSDINVGSGETVAIDRLDIRRWAIAVGEAYKPPTEAAELFDLFERADLTTAQRFLDAAKAYHTSYVVAPETTTGAVAYLVVAAESLLEDSLEVCPTCDQRRGILDATRRLFFRELPCFNERRSKGQSFVQPRLYHPFQTFSRCPFPSWGT